MKQKEVFKKIGGIIQELSEQYEYLQTTVDNLNDLELELFVANAHFLTDHIEILCKLNLQNKPKRAVIEKPETSYQQKFFEPVVQQMKPGADLRGLRMPKPQAKPVEVEVINNLPEPPEEKPVIQLPAAKQPEEHITPQFDFTSQAPEDSYSFIREEPETIRHELILDEAETWEDEEDGAVAVKQKEEEKTEETPAAAATETPVITEEAVTLPHTIETIEPVIEEVKAEESFAQTSEAEVISAAPAKEDAGEAEVITRNQQISSQQGDKTASKSDQLSIKPISDIKLAITLNDKLLYVKDLFNGYNLAYSEAIEILNRFNTFEEAQRFLNTNYVTKNNWESKPATAEKLYALLKRRYA
ncbi:hypothetical protein [Mucilaginibacter xinganensis]|uniref:Uncharacterized protein n=1 Tax=Mucilaginibacter xinganensis TaxID=1234841 RepID=A0A223P0N7_9SPHI|nr:hypothetical protein [Mucilaginibacter xinganensis]ASU35675.1 hypothetical protein MuYL_3790 [Mucilaginibacter xinganensis]